MFFVPRALHRAQSATLSAFILYTLHNRLPYVSFNLLFMSPISHFSFFHGCVASGRIVHVIKDARSWLFSLSFGPVSPILRFAAFFVVSSRFALVCRFLTLFSGTPISGP